MGYNPRVHYLEKLESPFMNHDKRIQCGIEYYMTPPESFMKAISWHQTTENWDEVTCANCRRRTKGYYREGFRS